MTTPANLSALPDWIAALTEFHAAGKPLQGDGMLVLRDILIAANASLAKVSGAVKTITDTKRAHRELAKTVKRHLAAPDDLTRQALDKLLETPA